MWTAVAGAAALVAGFSLLRRYLGSRSSWRFDLIPSQAGKVVICTGGNTGIGFQFCRHMARQKAHVIMASRSEERGKAAIEAIRKEFPEAKIELRLVDVADLNSEFAKGILKDFDRLDVLVNNAGIANMETQVNDGVERTFATNNVGPFLLTGLLLPLLEKTKYSRIVTVSSIVHKFCSAQPRTILNDPTRNSVFHRDLRYQISKVINILVMKEIAKRLATKHSSTISVACHPGYASTDIQSHIANPIYRFFVYNIFNHLVAQSAEMGAAPLLYAATYAGVENGGYYGPCGLYNADGWPGVNEIGGLANDEAYGKESWAWLEEWSNYRFPI